MKGLVAVLIFCCLTPAQSSGILPIDEYECIKSSETDAYRKLRLLVLVRELEKKNVTASGREQLKNDQLDYEYSTKTKGYIASQQIEIIEVNYEQTEYLCGKVKY